MQLLRVAIWRTINVCILALPLHHLGAQQPYNNAALWRSWPATAREAYVSGLAAGVAEAYFAAAFEWLPQREWSGDQLSDRVRKVREKLFPWTTSDQIPAVMNDLYADPANAFVSLKSMVFIARDRIGGQDVAAALMKARKQALDDYELSKPKRPPGTD